jgi:hypothetical protein
VSDKTTWPAGTDVVVLRDNGEKQRTKTTSEPFRVPRGRTTTWCVMLEGIRGWYLLDRCTKADT